MLFIMALNHAGGKAVIMDSIDDVFDHMQAERGFPKKTMDEARVKAKLMNLAFESMVLCGGIAKDLSPCGGQRAGIVCIPHPVNLMKSWSAFFILVRQQYSKAVRSLTGGGDDDCGLMAAFESIREFHSGFTQTRLDSLRILRW